MPTESSTTTLTATLPAVTLTETTTSTMPTGTETLTSTLTLPDSTLSATTTYTLPSGAQTVTDTVTLPSSTGTATRTFTLPSGTVTATFTLPTKTMSKTVTLPTATDTAVLPSGTETVTLPSGSDTLTHEVTKISTDTVTATGTATDTSTPTLTIARFNYSGALAPADFVEGQEVRIRVAAELSPGDSLHVVQAFDLSETRFAAFPWSPAIAADCAEYVNREVTPLWDTAAVGIWEGLTSLDTTTALGAVYATFAAPSTGTPFVVCFTHQVTTSWASPVTVGWQVFSTSADEKYLFEASPSRTWYNIPHATAGQYAIIQLLSTESWNFTYPAQACAASTSAADLGPCAYGDNLKIVPTGEPCTQESALVMDKYMGGNQVAASGQWDAAALPGLLSQATAGGVGRFGTQYANPLVDEWTSPGEYYDANTEAHSSTWAATTWDVGAMSHSYAYVRLPTAVGMHFDVCFSSLEQRAALRDARLRFNRSAAGAVPVWRKLRHCLAPPCSTSGPFPFRVAEEPVGWSMFDLSPNSWGTIVFDDSGEGGLSSAPQRRLPNSSAAAATPGEFPVALKARGRGAWGNYWDPAGGDYFRIVAASSFGETRTVNSTTGWHMGSPPAVGCWSTALDAAVSSATSPSHGGWSTEGAEYPAGSWDLEGDPSDPQKRDDLDAQEATFATLWVPTESTQWHVCYRRTCPTGCAKHAGFRVLPWHDESRGSVPRRWHNLGRLYTPGRLPGAALLVPYEYGGETAVWDKYPAGTLVRVESPDQATVGGYLAPHPAEHRGYPPAVTWYMNDTREGTWGPLLLEKGNYSEYARLDSRPWNLVRSSYGCVEGECDTVRDTAGTALRLVPPDKPCDMPGFPNDVTVVSVTDGGAIECNSQSAQTDTEFCMGSAADTPAVSTVAFYFRVPRQSPSGYRVCFRLHGWNWREVWPTGEGVTAWGDPHQPSGARQRGSWRTPFQGQAASTNPGPEPDRWFEVRALGAAQREAALAAGMVSLTEVRPEWREQRAGMEALFLVSDGAGSLSAAPRRPCPGGCEDSGDVFRLVPSTANCDINPSVWDEAAARRADTHLSLHCPRRGAGTTAQSGLYGSASAPPHGACPSAPPSRALCGGAVCSSARSAQELELLSRFAWRTPDVYDDIVPGDHTHFNHDTVAAAVVVPEYDALQDNTYKLCYKQMGTANWIIFNESWTVDPLQPYSLSYPPGRDLLGGELQKFELAFPDPVALDERKSVLPAAVRAFAAKLVPLTGLDNSNCLNPAGGTEAEPLAGSTVRYRVGSSARHLEFHLVVPHKPGRYLLCVQVRLLPSDTLSWYRPSEPFEVQDNGVRWFVTSGNQPTNRGVSVVSLVRCAARGDGSCGRADSIEVFNTTAGGDAAKIVKVVPDGESDACHGAELPYDQSADHGCSAHLAVEGGGVAGVSDLGTGDGPTDIAEAPMTLPAVIGDRPTLYKLCVRSRFTVGGRTRSAWVEVAQGNFMESQVRVLGPSGAAPAFRTHPGAVRAWGLAAALRPGHNLVAGSVLGGARMDPVAEVVGVGGASTSYVADAGTPTQSDGVGFWFETHPGADTANLGDLNEFKLVLAARPVTRTPPGGGAAGWQWERVGGAACLGLAAASATNEGSCEARPGDAGGCPGLTALVDGKLHAFFHLPVDPGQYAVCYRARSYSQPQQPWLWLPHLSAPAAPPAWGFNASAGTCAAAGGPAGGLNYLYTVPSYLFFEASATNVTVMDLRTAQSADGSVASPLASWCRADEAAHGTGVACRTDYADTYLRDLLLVANGSQYCPRPTLAALSSWTALPHGWFDTWRTANVSVAAINSAAGAAFSLPPARPDPTGQYKICIFKAGDAAGFRPAAVGAPSGRWLAPRGVVYQVPDLQTAAGHWADATATARLHIDPDLGVNSTLRFMVWDNSTAELYRDVPRDLLTEPGSGLVSNTPVIRSGTFFDVMVRAGTDNATVPYGRYEVWIEKCPEPRSWADLECRGSFDAEYPPVADPFVVVNLGGSCRRESSRAFGWGPHGLRQFLEAGAVRFRLQYRSACRTTRDDNFWGCGLRFAALPPGAQRPIYSSPMWVNVEEHWPDAVQLDGFEVDPGVGLEQLGAERLSPAHCVGADDSAVGAAESRKACYMKTCTHMQECSLLIQARWRGPAEFAPSGTLSVEYSEQDYRHSLQENSLPSQLLQAFEGGSWRVKRSAVWAAGGTQHFVNRPQLRGGVREGYLFLNVSFARDSDGAFTRPGGGTWTRAVVRVVRQQPVSVLAVDAVPLDVAGARPLSGAGSQRTPAPVWHAAGAEGVHPRPSTELRAAPGSYLEALVPYEFLYEVCADGSSPCGSPMPPDIPTPMDGWGLTATVRGEAENKVLAVWADTLNGSVSYPHTNLLSSPLYATQELRAVAPGNSGGGAAWRQRFRVKSSLGCSRFNEAGGCRIDFLFEREGRRIAATLHTPVRVVGQGLMVLGPHGGALPDGDSLTRGITVTVVPGVMTDGGDSGGSRWLADEFHYGDIFAMLHAPLPSDGATNRDGAALLRSDEAEDFSAASCAHSTPGGPCAIWQYAPRAVGSTWGARWRLRTSHPCSDCELTFHSGWGAGPQHFGGGSSVGTHRLSFADDTTQVGCYASAAFVETAAPSTRSSPFSVLVEPQNQAGVNTRWPEWWVFVDAERDVVQGDGFNFTSHRLRQNGSDATLLRARMALGPPVPWYPRKGGAQGSGAEGANVTGAVFGGLYFEGSMAEADQFQLTVSFRAVGQRYDASIAGAVAVAAVAHNCSVTVALKRGVRPAAERFLSIADVSGAAPLCEQRRGCTRWYTTTSTDLVRVSAWFYNQTGDEPPLLDPTARNVTVRLGSQIPFKCPEGPAASGRCTSDCSAAQEQCTLQSNAVNNEFTAWDGAVYTYGKAPVVLSRTLAGGAAAPRGKGTIEIEQQGTVATRSPVNGARLSVCASYMREGAEVIDAREGWRGGTPCAVVELWILVENPPLHNAIFAIAPNATTAQPGTGECGRSATLFDIWVLTYFTLPELSATRRFVAYDRPITYRLRVEDQAGGAANLLAWYGDTRITNETLVLPNPVPVAATVAQRLANSSAVIQTEKSFPFPSTRFQFYGLRATAPEGARARIDAALSTGTAADIAPALSPSFRWSAPAENYSTWELLGAVAVDDECPRKRYMAVSDANYRSYAPTPGQGWRYADGAAVGLPFPIQAVVRTSSVSPPGRAWTFKRSLVTVRRALWSGCNDGGNLTLHTLRPSGVADTVLMLPNQTGRPIFVPAPDGAFTDGGAVTLWPSFSAPCESCALELRLCRSGAAGAGDCFDSAVEDGNTDGATGQIMPGLAERIQVTRPFAVRFQRPDSVVLTAQTVPGAVPVEGGPYEIQVGERFSVAGEPVQSFGRWVMRSGGAGLRSALYAASRWEPGGDALDASAMRYGNGGFMAATAAGSPLPAPCAVSAAQVSTATRFGALLDSPQSTFFFTRPCHRCSVWLRWELQWAAPGGGEQLRAAGEFPMRSYGEGRGYSAPGAGLLHFRVRACGTAWLLAGQPPGAVRRSKPFSLSAWRVDANNFPSWDSGGAAPPSARLLANESAGNGGGGELRLSSPDPPAITAGTVTVRLGLSRACWQCRLRFAGLEHELAVLSDPTQIVVLPSAADSYSPTQRVQGEYARWEFVVYAADEFGERAYSVGGPTLLRWQPVHRQRKLFGAPLRALPFAGELIAPASSIDEAGQQRRLVQTTTGAPTITVHNGSTLFNGIPYAEIVDPSDPTSPGVAVVELSGSPAVGVPLRLAAGAHEGLPTNYFGTTLPPVVDWSVEADRIVLASPRRLPARVGETLQLRVLAVAPWGDARNGTAMVLYQSVLATAAEVTLAINCSACPECVLAEPREGAVSSRGFVRGEAVFTISFARVGAVEAECGLAVSADGEGLPNSAPQRATLVAIPLTLTKWAWAPTASFAPEGLPSYSAVTAGVTANDSVALRLRAWDDAFLNFSQVAGLEHNPEQRLTLTVSPPGCFLCKHPGEAQYSDPRGAGCLPVIGGRPWAAGAGGAPSPGIAPYGAELTLHGHFPRGDCEISDIGGLPAGTALAQPIVVSVGVPASVELLRHHYFGTRFTNFSGLTGTTRAGDPAAVAGRPAGLHFRVLDARGDVVHGDRSTTVVLRGARMRRRFGDSAPVCDCATLIFGPVDDPDSDPDAAATDSPVGPPAPTGNATNGTAPARSAGALQEGPLPDSLTGGCAGQCQTVRLEQRAEGGAARFALGATALLSPTYGSPWRFRVSARHQGRPLRSAVREVGPLHVVVQGSQLQVEFRPHSGDWGRLPDLRNGDSGGEKRRWVWGYPFALRLTAHDTVDRGALCGAQSGRAACEVAAEQCEWAAEEGRCGPRGTPAERANVPQHPGELGHDANVVLRPVMVPCYQVDWLRGPAGALENQPWLRQTCVAEGQCEWLQQVPQCSSGGWRVGRHPEALSAGPHELQLRSGGLELPRVVYADSRAVGGARQGPARFMLTTDAFASALPYVYTGEIHFQKIHALTLLGAGASCRAEGPLRNRCTLPATVGEPGVGLGLPRVRRRSFSLLLRIADSAGGAVAGDDVSNVTLSATCHDPIPDSAFLLGIVGGVRGDLINTPRGWDTATARQGLVHFTALGFRGGCRKASMALECTTPAEVDTEGSCRGKAVVTEFFEVVEGDGGPLLTPAPPFGDTPAPGESPLPAVTLSLGLVSLASFRQRRSVFAANLASDIKLHARVFAQVWVRQACEVPSERATGGIPVDTSGLSCAAFPRAAGGRLPAALQGSPANVLLVRAEASIQTSDPAAALRAAVQAALADPSSGIRSEFPSLDGAYAVFGSSVRPTPRPAQSKPPGGIPPTAPPSTAAPTSRRVDVTITSPAGRGGPAAALAALAAGAALLVLLAP